jgi:hypothetical protein
VEGRERPVAVQGAAAVAAEFVVLGLEQRRYAVAAVQAQPPARVAVPVAGRQAQVNPSGDKGWAAGEDPAARGWDKG